MERIDYACHCCTLSDHDELAIAYKASLQLMVHP